MGGFCFYIKLTDFSDYITAVPYALFRHKPFTKEFVDMKKSKESQKRKRKPMSITERALRGASAGEIIKVREVLWNTDPQKGYFYFRDDVDEAIACLEKGRYGNKTLLWVLDELSDQRKLSEALG